MEEIIDKILVRSDGSRVAAKQALQDKHLVCFYFSAQWCPPCRRFTGILKDFYEEVHEEGLEVIFVSFDKSHDQMFSYMREHHGDWLATRLDSTEARKLKLKFYISSIPQLVVCRKSGKVLTKYGRDDVEKKGPLAIKEWIENEDSPMAC